MNFLSKIIRQGPLLNTGHLHALIENMELFVITGF